MSGSQQNENDFYLRVLRNLFNHRACGGILHRRFFFIFLTDAFYFWTVLDLLSGDGSILCCVRWKVRLVQPRYSRSDQLFSSFSGRIFPALQRSTAFLAANFWFYFAVGKYPKCYRIGDESSPLLLCSDVFIFFYLFSWEKFYMPQWKRVVWFISFFYPLWTIDKMWKFSVNFQYLCLHTHVDVFF